MGHAKVTWLPPYCLQHKTKDSVLEAILSHGKVVGEGSEIHHWGIDNRGMVTMFIMLSKFHPGKQVESSKVIFKTMGSKKL